MNSDESPNAGLPIVNQDDQDDDLPLQEVEKFLDLAKKFSHILPDLVPEYPQINETLPPEIKFLESILAAATKFVFEEMWLQDPPDSAEPTHVPDRFIPSELLTEWLAHAWINDSEPHHDTGARAANADRRDLANRVGQEIEGLFSLLARRAASLDQSAVRITEHCRLARDAGLQLLDTLDVDPHLFAAASYRLSEELNDYVTANGLARPWGRLCKDEHGIMLSVELDHFAKPIDLDSLDPSYWKAI